MRRARASSRPSQRSAQSTKRVGYCSAGYRHHKRVTAHMRSSPDEARRALVLHERQLVVDLIELTLNHGLFVVRARAAWRRRRRSFPSGGRTWPWSTWTTRTAPRCSTARGLEHPHTQRDAGPRPHPTGRLKTKLRAFDLGVDDILTMPFSPEELLARRSSSPAGDGNRIARSSRRSGSVRSRSTSSTARCAPGIGRPPERDRAEPVVPPRQSCRARRDREEILDAIWGTDSWPRATSSIATSGACASSCRTTTAIRASSRRSRQGYRFIPTFSNRGWGGAGTERPGRTDDRPVSPCDERAS